MRKYLVLLVLCLPVCSFAASSVKVLGNKPVASTNVSVNKVVPGKNGQSVTNNPVSSRAAGVLRAKPKVNVPVKTVDNDTVSRFPVVVSTRKMGAAAAPKQMVNSTNVDVDAIVNAVNEGVAQNYYNKVQVDDKLDALEPQDDPRFDGIVLSNNPDYDPAAKWTQKGMTLPSNYVYMWVEK